MSRARDLASYASNNAGNTAGVIAFFADDEPPAGWLECNGALVSRTTYASLFAVIGTTYGAGDGSTTFALPDLRGEFLRGWDNGRAVDTGRSFGSAQADDYKTHAHTTLRNSSGGGLAQNYITTTASVLDGGTAVANTFLPTTNSGGSETRPRNVAMLPCIKT